MGLTQVGPICIAGSSAGHFLPSRLALTEARPPSPPLPAVLHPRIRGMIRAFSSSPERPVHEPPPMTIAKRRPPRAAATPPLPAFTPVPRQGSRHDGWTPRRPDRLYRGAGRHR